MDLKFIATGEFKMKIATRDQEEQTTCEFTFTATLKDPRFKMIKDYARVKETFIADFRQQLAYRFDGHVQLIQVNDFKIQADL